LHRRQQEVRVPVRTKSVRLIGIAVAVAVAACLTAVATAQAAPDATKTYTINLIGSSEENPAQMAAGAQETLTARIKNTSPQQQLGSINLTIPSPQFTVQSPGTDNVIRLRNLALAPGATRDIPLTLTAAGCAAGSFSATAAAKQSNDFNGPPGNAFTLVAPSSLRIDVSGSCALEFTAEPAHTLKDGAIRSVPFAAATSTDYVSVRAVDGDGKPLPAFRGEVTLAVNNLGYGGAFKGGSDFKENAGADGVARFPLLSIGASGVYSLTATTTSLGYTPDVSAEFQVTDTFFQCDEFSCDSTDIQGDVSLRIQGDLPSGEQGFLLISKSIGPALGCDGFIPGYSSPTNDWYQFFVTNAQATKLVTLIYSKQTMRLVPNNGAAFLEVCFGAPFGFDVKPGSVDNQFYDYDGAGPGTVGERGLLPDCGAVLPTVGGCVLSRNKTGAGDGVVRVFVAKSGEDPRMH
jgi:hypothetical protein